MLQQYHWITGWLQPRCERPLSFVEDDKLRPGEDVTSSKRRHKSSMKCAIAKFLNQDGRPDRYWKLKMMMKNSAKNPDPAQETDLVVPDTRRSPEEAEEIKTTGCVISERMSWKARRRSRTRRWFARRFWKLHEDQHVLSFSVHL